MIPLPYTGYLCYLVAGILLLFYYRQMMANDLFHRYVYRFTIENKE